MSSKVAELQSCRVAKLQALRIAGLYFTKMFFHQGNDYSGKTRVHRYLATLQPCPSATLLLFPYKKRELQ